MNIDFLDNDLRIKEVYRVLENHEVFVVGGAVRNCLMGYPIKDLDFATSAHPDTVEELFTKAGYKPILTGKAFGTIRVIISDMEVEITTYRSHEKYTSNNRKPSVVFGKSIMDDLKRRDFTINAMAYNPTIQALVDPYNGQQAIEQKRLVTPLDPSETFADDPLRMLRALRFQATYGFLLTEDVFHAIVKNAHKMLYLSSERIKAEMDRLLIGPHAAEALRGLVATRLANFILPELLPMVGMKQNETYHHKNVFEHTLSVVSHCPATPVMRWAGLLHDIGKPATWQVIDTGIHFYNHEDLGARMAEEIAYRFKFSTDERVMVKQLVKYHMRPNLYRSEWKDEAVRRMKRECQSFLSELMDLSRADCTSMRPEKVENALLKIKELEDRLDKEPEPLKKCPLSGYAIMEKFHLKPGPVIGMLQSYLLKKIEAGVKADDTEILWSLSEHWLTGLQIKIMCSKGEKNDTTR